MERRAPGGRKARGRAEVLGRCRGTSLMRKRPPLGPYRSLVPRVMGGSQGGGRVLMSEVPL